MGQEYVKDCSSCQCISNAEAMISVQMPAASAQPEYQEQSLWQHPTSQTLVGASATMEHAWMCTPLALKYAVQCSTPPQPTSQPLALLWHALWCRGCLHSMPRPTLQPCRLRLALLSCALTCNTAHWLLLIWLKSTSCQLPSLCCQRDLQASLYAGASLHQRKRCEWSNTAG